MTGGKFFEATACSAGCLPWGVLGRLGIGVSVYRYADDPSELQIVYRNDMQQETTGIRHGDIPPKGMPAQFTEGILEELKRALPLLPEWRSYVLRCCLTRMSDHREPVEFHLSYLEHGGDPFVTVQTIDGVRGEGLARFESAEHALRRVVELGQGVLSGQSYDEATAPGTEHSADDLLARVVDVMSAPRPDELRQKLTRRECEVCDCVLRGLSNEQTAEEMFVTADSVHKYRTRIRSKLGLVGQVIRLRDALLAAGWQVRA